MSAARVRRALAALALAASALVAAPLTATPAQAAVYSQVGQCFSPTDARNSMQASFSWESSGGLVRLRSISVVLFRDNSMYDWGTSLSVADRTSSVNYWSYSHNPGSSGVYSVPSNWTSATFRNGRVSVNGCTIIRYA